MGREGLKEARQQAGSALIGGARAGDARRSKGRSLEAVIGDEEAWEAGAIGCGAPGGGAGTRAEPSYSELWPGRPSLI